MENSLGYIPRLLDLRARLSERSCFLFGPRQTGKSTLIRETLPDSIVFDLLLPKDFLDLSSDPMTIANAVDATDKSNQCIVVIDEIQRLPSLLNVVHHLIETRSVRFLLTGSSTRKLRRGGVNLLGGRARTLQFHPLVRRELGNEFNLLRVLQHGTLPFVYRSSSPRVDLDSYIGNYLQLEVQAEGLTRNLPAFSRVLGLVAACNASIVNFTNLSSDAQVARTTVMDYFDILKETLILRELPAWRESRRRKPITSSKYYFFDTGVASSLQGRETLPRGSPELGFAFETFMLNELNTWSDYQSGETLHFWRSNSGFEVDFLIGDHTAVEVKAKPTVGEQDLRSLKALRQEGIFKKFLCVSLGERHLVRDGIEILPYERFLDNLWDGVYSD